MSIVKDRSAPPKKAMVKGRLKHPFNRGEEIQFRSYAFADEDNDAEARVTLQLEKLYVDDTLSRSQSKLKSRGSNARPQQEKVSLKKPPLVVSARFQKKLATAMAKAALTTGTAQDYKDMVKTLKASIRPVTRVKSSKDLKRG